MWLYVKFLLVLASVIIASINGVAGVLAIVHISKRVRPRSDDAVQEQREKAHHHGIRGAHSPVGGAK